METCDVLYFSDKVFENLIFIPVIVNGIEATALFDTGSGYCMRRKMGHRLSKPLFRDQ